MKTNIRRLGLVTVLASGSIVAVGVAPALAVCDAPPGWNYNTTQVDRYVGNRATRVFGAPGTLLQISRGTTKTVSGELQTTATVEAGVIFAKVSATVGVTVGLSMAVTTTQGGEWLVPATKPSGWFEMGAHGYQINWKKGTYVSPCRFVVADFGSLLGPTSSPYFMHN
jgi:hypothetical protein